MSDTTSGGAGPRSGSGTDQGQVRGSSKVVVRRDIEDTIRLIRYVAGRRANLAAAGRPTEDLDYLLRKLRGALGSQWPLRSWTRRQMLSVCTAVGTAGALLSPSGIAGIAGGGVGARAAEAAGQSVAKDATGLRPLPPDAAPFDANDRATMALDLLTFFARQHGLFPGRNAYLLPAAPWFGGYEPRAARRRWELSVPAGTFLYLLACADESGRIDASSVSITINGAPLGSLAGYVHGDVQALYCGQVRQQAVLDLVLPPPAPGRYRVEVRGGTAQETVLHYDITVESPAALGPLALRDSAGRVHVLEGGERRHVPDEATLRLLAFPPHAVLPASRALLASIPEGAPLPALVDGLLLRMVEPPAIFRVDGGKRARLRTPAALPEDALSGIRPVETAIAQTIPPLLADGTLLKSAGADVYHAERGELRKVPSWQWVTERGLDPEDMLRVPDRLLATLPQNSPHWYMPGGAARDAWFFSEALGRLMPYRVYVPPEYAAAERAGQRYPAIYLLHGMSGRYDEWSGYGLTEVANALLSMGQFAHAIVVMPQGGLGYWMDQDGGTRWGEYVARDLVNHVDRTYRTLARPEARAIGGLSMGAHGAAQLALNYPDVFRVAGVHSPSIRSRDQAPAYFGSGAAFARRDPISLVASNTLSQPPLMWIDAAEQDPWRPGAVQLRQALLERGWPHEWHSYAGEHDGWYWGDHIWEYLPFYARAFATLGVPLVR